MFESEAVHARAQPRAFLNSAMFEQLQAFWMGVLGFFLSQMMDLCGCNERRRKEIHSRCYKEGILLACHCMKEVGHTGWQRAVTIFSLYSVVRLVCGNRIRYPLIILR